MIYNLFHPTHTETPIVISIPHCGLEFPPDIKNLYNSKHVENPQDTDWHLEHLYSFAPSLGVHLMTAKFSRYVIDLNRDPEGRSLYSDSRVETELVPSKTFHGQPLYGQNYLPDAKEVQRRKTKYYDPYHKGLTELLERTRDKFGYALLFEAHSIRHFVPSLSPTEFPDLILGDQDGYTALDRFVSPAIDVLKQNNYGLSFSYNVPFKGGYLTRSQSKPSEQIYSMQLEMCQKNYMNEETFEYNQQKAEPIITLLKLLFQKLIIA